MTYKIELDDPVEGYTVYRIMNGDKVVFKSSAPQFIARDMAFSKLERIIKDEQIKCL